MQRKATAILLILAPIPTLLATLFTYAVAHLFLMSVMEASGRTNVLIMIGYAVNIFLGLVGIVAIAGIVVGIPVGIYLLASEDGATGQKKNSGH